MSFYTVKAIDDLTIFTTTRHKPSQFSADWSTTEDELARELRRLGARESVIEVAVSASDIRRDGGLRASARPFHSGVRLSFRSRDRGEMSFTCDTYAGYVESWKDNVRGIVKTLEALRAVDRYGATKGEQYAGFAALPPGAGAKAMGGMTSEEARSIIGSFGPVPVMQMTDDDARRAYRKARAAAHPDRHDGDQTLWDQVEQAARVLGLDS